MSATVVSTGLVVALFYAGTYTSSYEAEYRQFHRTKTVVATFTTHSHAPLVQRTHRQSKHEYDYKVLEVRTKPGGAGGGGGGGWRDRKGGGTEGGREEGERERETEFYFSTVKILAQRPTDISVVATVHSE